MRKKRNMGHNFVLVLAVICMMLAVYYIIRSNALLNI